MIESIFSGASILKKSNQQNSIAAVSIEILPEFGWRFGNHRAFGPGTLFQGDSPPNLIIDTTNKPRYIGYVVVKCNQYSARATRLRLHFKGIESLLTYDVGPGIIRTQTNTLFRVRSTLWQKQDENDSLCSDIKYKFLFTLQMPMVQYPPSIDHNLYRCSYKLSAYLDPSLGYGEIPVMAQSQINYIPLIETRLLKAPLYLESVKRKQQKPLFSVKLYSTEYVSGDMLRFAICNTTPGHPSLNTSTTVHATLYRIFSFHDKEVPTVTEIMASQLFHLNVKDLKEETWLSFKIHDDTVPTVTFSTILSITYKLKIKIGSLNQGSNKIKKLMAWPSSTSSCSFETPITIGSMGLGVRVVEELRLYGSIHIPSPKFIKNLEHEDVLPKYEPSRLPSYSTEGNNNANTMTVGCITPASSVTIIRSSL